MEHARSQNMLHGPCACNDIHGPPQPAVGGVGVEAVVPEVLLTHSSEGFYITLCRQVQTEPLATCVGVPCSQ